MTIGFAERKGKEQSVEPHKKKKRKETSNWEKIKVGTEGEESGE